jgi:hypothetical protein
MPSRDFSFRNHASALKQTSEKEKEKVNWKLLAIKVLPIALTVAIASVNMYWCGGWEWFAV